ncbi:putative aldo-keto reductase [Rhizobium freirei PRF 81]|uniref:Aldo/keto reductase n=2 Tax=Rhizobium TaxID=379 RepID=Q933C5_RHITR|nr:putative aldo-keto reductase [Rhizobium tropici CIAT 899]AFJ42555.1 putative aldo-keto reductase [Rhizobium tropici]AYG70458.1 aldo/keto reductase [Rhizobium sp. CCGE531]ENN84792.1 putative aldo-keto reductase [Rhizobium freirei PRF 81]TGE91423.1 aldo/keto reductase [Rhizobium sp. SEMIA 4088]
MQYRGLGRSGLKVSAFGLGTMGWGEQNTEAEARAQLGAALDVGVNFVDTAEMYPVPPRVGTTVSRRAISTVGCAKPAAGRMWCFRPKRSVPSGQPKQTCPISWTAASATRAQTFSKQSMPAFKGCRRIIPICFSCTGQTAVRTSFNSLA